MQYLKRRHRTYWAQVAVPLKLRPILGKRVLERTLSTTCPKKANVLKLPVVAEFRRRIEAAERKGVDDNAAIFSKALELRATLEQLRGRVQVSPTGDEIPDDFEAVDAVLEEARALYETHGPTIAARFHAAVTGNATLLNDMIEPWLAEAGDIRASTLDHHEQAAKALVAWAGAGVTVEEFDGKPGREKAGEYVTKLLAQYARATVGRHLYHLATWWDWLATKGKTADNAPAANPWRGHKVNKKSKRGAVNPNARRPWKDHELMALLKGTFPPQWEDLYRNTLPDLIKLALLTGGRLAELCDMKTEAVEERDDGLWLTVTEGKTNAALRDIPLHPLAAAIVKRRLKSPDGYLFPNLLPGGADKKRSHHVSKAFGRFTRDVLKITDPGLVFHALRATFTDMMEGREVPTSTVKLLIGHARSDITFGLYSKGERVNLRAAINKLAYGPEVMELLGQ